MPKGGIYCGERLKQVLGDDPSVKAIPVVLLSIVVGYAADERFVRPLYVGQAIIARDMFQRWYDAKVLEIRPESVLLNYPDLASCHDEVIGVQEIDERIAADGPDCGMTGVTGHISRTISQCIVDCMKAELSSVVVGETMPVITVSRFLNENAPVLEGAMARLAFHCGIEMGEISDVMRFSHHIMIRVHNKFSRMWIPLFPPNNIPQSDSLVPQAI